MDSHEDHHLHLHKPRSPKPHKNSDTENEYDYDVPDNYLHLNELAAPCPVQNPSEERIYRHQSLEESISRDQEHIRKQHHEEINRSNDPGQESNDKGRSWWTLLCRCFAKP